MKVQFAFFGLLVALSSAWTYAQTPSSPPPPEAIFVKCAADVQPHVPAGAKILDLQGVTVLPGLIDCHTHLMARFANTPDGYLLSLAQKSQAYRALEGAADADELRLDQRYWTCPKCKATHDRDVNAARNLLMEGLRQLAGRDDRDLRVDAREASPEEILWEVLAHEARSGQCHRACMEQARWH